MSAPAMLVAALLAQATPYVRLGSANDQGVHHCLWWPVAPVLMAAHVDGTPELDADAEFSAISRSIETWRAQFEACGSLEVSEGPRIADRFVGYNPKSRNDNQNVIVFRQQQQCRDVVAESDACWDDSIYACANSHDCWPHQRGALAITTNSFSPENGLMFDADVEFNDGSFRFTATEATEPLCISPDFANCVFWDLQNTMTHELGHVFGLDHDPDDPSSTMFREAAAGDTFMRTLEPASQQFVCDVYPRGGFPQDCVIQRLDPDLGANTSCGAVGIVPVGLWVAWLRRRRRS